MYFMRPGQVHSWNFEGVVDGYVVNFSGDLFHRFLTNERYLEKFAFFRGSAAESVSVVFTTWTLTLGMSFRDNSIFWCLRVGVVILLLLQPVLQRLSRSIWIVFFVRYDKDWAINKGSSEVFN